MKQAEVGSTSVRVVMSRIWKSNPPSLRSLDLGFKFTLLRFLGAKSSLDVFLLLSLRIIRAAANAMVFLLLSSWAVLLLLLFHVVRVACCRRSVALAGTNADNRPAAVVAAVPRRPVSLRRARKHGLGSARARVTHARTRPGARVLVGAGALVVDMNPTRQRRPRRHAPPCCRRRRRRRAWCVGWRRLERTTAKAL